MTDTNTQHIGAKNVTGSERNTARLWQLLQTALNKAFTQSLLSREASVSAPVTGRWRHEKQGQFGALDGELLRRLSTFCYINLSENKRMLNKK